VSTKHYILSPQNFGFSRNINVFDVKEKFLFSVSTQRIIIFKKRFSIKDQKDKEIMHSKQKAILWFAKHEMKKENDLIFTVGRNGIAPNQFYVNFESDGQFEIKISSFKSSHILTNGVKNILTIKRKGIKWFVEITDNKIDHLLLLYSASIIFNEYLSEG
jgi:hypothetical protein